MDDDPSILICLPTKGVPKSPVPGGVKRICSKCRQQVWLAPSGMRIQREYGTILLCIPCAAKDKEIIDGRLHAPTDAQVREIMDYLRDEAS